MEAPTGTVQKYERDDIRGCDRIRVLMVRENSGSEFISDIRNGLAHCKDADLVAFNKKWLKTSRSSSQAFMLMFIEIMQEFRMLDPQLFVSPPCFRIAFAVSFGFLCSSTLLLSPPRATTPHGDIHCPLPCGLRWVGKKERRKDRELSLLLHDTKSGDLAPDVHGVDGGIEGLVS